jgi:hypothetical protein
MGRTIGALGFDSRRGLEIVFFTTASRTALGPTQPPIQWVPGALSLGVKRPGSEADHSPPTSAEVKECMQLYLHSPNTPSWRGAELSTGPTLPFYLYLYLPICPDCIQIKTLLRLTAPYMSLSNTFIYPLILFTCCDRQIFFLTQ